MPGAAKVRASLEELNVETELTELMQTVYAAKTTTYYQHVSGNIVDIVGGMVIDPVGGAVSDAFFLCM